MKATIYKKFSRFAVICVAVLMPTVAAATEPHFTFTIPLELNSLPPEVTGYQVSCAVLAGLSMIGSGETSGPISGGTFRGDAVVTVMVTGINPDPSRATNYSCGLHLTGVIDISRPDQTGNRAVYMDDSNTRFPLATGAPFRKSTGEVALPR